MSKALVVSLIIFSIIWFILIIRSVKTGKISVKYSLVWFVFALVILLVGLFPKFFWKITKFLGFMTISNMIVGVILTLLMLITLWLTMIVTNQKTQIKNLTQEVSILMKEKNK